MTSSGVNRRISSSRGERQCLIWTISFVLLCRLGLMPLATIRTSKSASGVAVPFTLEPKAATPETSNGKLAFSNVILTSVKMSLPNSFIIATSSLPLGLQVFFHHQPRFTFGPDLALLGPACAIVQLLDSVGPALSAVEGLALSLPKGCETKRGPSPRTARLYHGLLTDSNRVLLMGCVCMSKLLLWGVARGVSALPGPFWELLTPHKSRRPVA